MHTYPSIDHLKDAPAARAEVRNELGAPRLYVNGSERFPLLAWSWLLEPSTYYFKRSGINILHPILGLNEIWKAPGEFEWHLFDKHFDSMLGSHPDAFFLPRVHLDVPEWWKDQHPGELVETAIPATNDLIDLV